MSSGHDTASVGWRDWAAWLLAASCLFFQFVVQIQPSAMIEELEQAEAERPGDAVDPDDETRPGIDAEAGPDDDSLTDSPADPPPTEAPGG